MFHARKRIVDSLGLYVGRQFRGVVASSATVHRQMRGKGCQRGPQRVVGPTRDVKRKSKECGRCITELGSIELLEQADRLVDEAEVSQRARELKRDLVLFLKPQTSVQRTAIWFDSLGAEIERIMNAAPLGQRSCVSLGALFNERSHAGQHVLRLAVIESLPERLNPGIPLSLFIHVAMIVDRTHSYRRDRSVHAHHAHPRTLPLCGGWPSS